jgi:predicted transcriptional regulator
VIPIPDITVGECKRKKDLIAVPIETPLHVVLMTMKNSVIRHLPIVDHNSNVIGVIDDIAVMWLNHSDFLDVLGHQPIYHFIPELKQTGYLTDSEKISDIVRDRLCSNRHITGLPVIEDQNGHKKLTGMLSYVNILEKIKSIYTDKPNDSIS